MIHPKTNLYQSPIIGIGTRIGAFCDVGGCTIGENCNIQALCSIPPGTVIGNNVFVGPGVRILNDRRPPNKELSPVIIEDDAVIGGGVVILPGVTIGKGAKIGAGAIVDRDIPPKSGWWVNNRELKEVK